MADVTLDPQNSDSKELFGQGVRAFVLQDYDTAVRAFSKASELLAAEHGDDMHDSLGDVYLYYGKSLLELSRKEGGALGEGVLKNVEDESEEEVEEGEETDKAEEEGSKANGDDNKTDDEKTEDKASEAKSENKSTEESGDAKASEEAEDEPGDDLTDLQVAWEVLELAKRIFTNRGADGQKNLAETLIVLGEISLESGNFSSAIEDIVQGLELQKKLFGNDSRTIAETYYKLGGAYSTNAQIDEAVESFKSSLEYLQNKVKTLKKDEEHKETNAAEIQEIETLVPEIEEKIVDMENVKKEIANKVKSSADESVAKTNGASEASSSSTPSKQVNDISHLVKRKRKEEESPQEEAPSKRPSP